MYTVSHEHTRLLYSDTLLCRMHTYCGGVERAEIYIHFAALRLNHLNHLRSSGLRGLHEESTERGSSTIIHSYIMGIPDL